MFQVVGTAPIQNSRVLPIRRARASAGEDSTRRDGGRPGAAEQLLARHSD